MLRFGTSSILILNEILCLLRNKYVMSGVDFVRSISSSSEPFRPALHCTYGIFLKLFWFCQIHRPKAGTSSGKRGSDRDSDVEIVKKWNTRSRGKEGMLASF